MQSENYTTDNVEAGRWLPSQDLFWPRIDLVALRVQLGLSAAVSNNCLEVAAHTAVHQAASEFAQWRRALRARGYKRLQDLATHACLSNCYQRAVQARTRQVLVRTLHVVECTVARRSGGESNG